MPQQPTKKIDFSDLGAKRIDFTDLGAQPVGQQLHTSRGASGSWDMTLEQLPVPAPVRSVLHGLSDIGEGVTNIARMPFEAAKSAYQTFRGGPSGLAPEEIPSFIKFGMPGAAIQRLTMGPQVEQAKKALEPIPLGSTSTLNVPTSMGSIPLPLEGLKRVGRAAAALTPVVGPWAAHLVETGASPSFGGEGKPLKAAGELGSGMMLPKVLKETARYTREAPVRKGLTTLDPVTGRPIPRAAPVQVKLGEPLPDKLPAGTDVAVDPAISTAAKALGGDKALDAGLALKDRLSLVAHELAEAKAEAPGIRTDKLFGRQFRDWNDVRLQFDYARRKLWDTFIAPGLKGTMKVQPILDDFMKNLPKDIKLFDRQAFEPVYQKFKEIFDAVPEIDVQTMQGLAARIREQIDLNANAFDRFGDLSVVKTAANKAFEDAIRKNLYDHIQAKTRVDIRPAMHKYGALSELQQDVLKMPEPQGFLERILSSYTFPTQRAVAARLGETLGKQQLGKVSLWNRAMRRIELDRTKLTSQVPEHPPGIFDDTPRDPITGELLMKSTPEMGPLLPGTKVRNPKFVPGEKSFADDTLRHPVTGEVLMATPPGLLLPGTTRRSLNFDQPGINPAFRREAVVSDPTPRHPVTGEILMPESYIYSRFNEAIKSNPAAAERLLTEHGIKRVGPFMTKQGKPIGMIKADGTVRWHTEWIKPENRPR